MPSKVVCFWLEPTDLVEISFRRFWSSNTSASQCKFERVPYPGHTPIAFGYHTEDAVIERRQKSDNDSCHTPTDAEKLDSRWPKKCSCGYVFIDADAWRVDTHMLYMTETWGLVTLRNAPAGAMYDADWYRGHGDKVTPDGKNLVLKTPEGDWHIDGPANNGPGWVRAGVPPRITCTPSIAIGGRMHGWLRNGVLEIDSP